MTNFEITLFIVIFSSLFYLARKIDNIESDINELKENLNIDKEDDIF